MESPLSRAWDIEGHRSRLRAQNLGKPGVQECFGVFRSYDCHSYYYFRQIMDYFVVWPEI